MVQFKLVQLVSVTLLAVCAQAQLQVGCYTGTQHNCGRFIDQFCNHATANTYSPRDSLNRCFNSGPGRRCDLTVWLKDPNGNAVTPSNANCKTALNTATTFCPSGGIGQFFGAPFQFSIDPNAGECAGAVGDGNRLGAVTEVVPMTAA